jgi:FKBP-type peptidyl-prolyl cis-trans isomerase
VFTLGAGSVIAGWDQGIPGMRVGGTRTLLVPSSLAYGSRGQGSIPPNAALVFDIELLNVQ